tara:strand:+ start:27034 stop:27633 length:600 start_codon:yes stop_codon:yes gene_type:complete
MSTKKVIAIATDIECSSFDMIGGDLLTAAMVEIYEDYTLGRMGCWYHRPTGPKYYSEKAREIHGISYWKALTFPMASESCIMMLRWLAEIQDCFPLEFVYHAKNKFDWSWMKMHFKKQEMEQSILKAFGNDMDDNKIVSTHKMAKENLVHLEDHKLPTICKEMGIELTHHEALSDAIAAAKIYCNIKTGQKIWTGELGV